MKVSSRRIRGNPWSTPLIVVFLVWLLPWTVSETLTVQFNGKLVISLCFPSLPFMLLVGHLWRGFTVGSHAALGLICGVDVESTDLDSRKRPLNLIWMPLQGVCWFFCCRQDFSLLGRDYGEKEEEESFELRNKEDLTPNGRVKKKKNHLHFWLFPVRNKCTSQIFKWR